jgi:hypothetical protein
VTEADIQKRVLDELKGRAMPGVVYWHTPHNRTSRRFSGYRAGVSDLCIIHRGKFYALELKQETGVARPEQIQFLADINAAGGSGIVAQGLPEAICALEKWGILRRAA